MFKLLDRQLIMSYLKAYVICFVSLLSLYIVVDLFTNIDDFTQGHRGLLDVVRHITTYYGYRSAQIFGQLSEAIVLLSAMFTVAWMQRHNELVPLLSAGVSTHRVVRPVLLIACCMLGLSAINTELIIPRIADDLFIDKDDPNGDHDINTPWAYEPNGIHLEGATASRKENLVRNFCVTIPENISNGLVHLIAREAVYIPGGPGKYTNGWLMTHTQPPTLDNWSNAEILECIDPGKYFLHTKEVDFAGITRSRNWFIFASTSRLLDEMMKPESLRLSAMAVLFHMRLTRPILGLLLVFLGLSMILRDQNRNIFISAGLCLVLCALVYAAMIGCKYLGDHGDLPPALAAWLPVLFFGPVAFVLFDAVHT